MEDIITLVGPRATGKSTVGRELAKKLGYEYIELDAVMNHELKSDGGVFGYATKYGWDKYMTKLHERLVSMFGTLKDKKAILDLGGGAIAAPEFPEAKLNADLVSKHSKILILLPTENDDENIKIFFEREKNRCKTNPQYYATKWPEEMLFKKVAEDYYNRVPILKKYANHHIYARELNPTQIVDLIERTILKDSK